MRPFPLPQRTLGRTGLEVTPIGLGGAWLGQTSGGGFDSAFDDDLATATVHRALELGINLIDTSPLYGESERRLGIALAAWYRRGGQRSDFVLSTKTGTRYRPYDYSGDGTKRSVDASLRLLQTDYLDVLLIHDPPDLVPVLAPGGALDTLKELKSQGVIRAVGLGVRDHEFHQHLMQTGDLDVALTYRDFNLLHQSARAAVIAPAAERGVGVFNAMALMYGLLGGDNPHEVAAREPRSSQDPAEVERAYELWQFANDHGVSLLALNLQWMLRETRVSSILCGASAPAHIEADVVAITTPIADEVWGELSGRFGV